LTKLAEYVQKHAARGACTCGRCIDAPPNPEEHQPNGEGLFELHTIDLTLFKVARSDSAKPDEFLDMVKEEFPHWLDGKEHNYLETGADIGDQGLALMAMGLGHLLGVWKVLAPETMVPSLPGELKQQMAGHGMISIQTEAKCQ